MIISIGVDPGPSCGLAILHDGKKHTVMQSDPRDVLTEIERVLAVHFGTANQLDIAYERYIIGPQTGKRTQQPVPLQIIGALERLADRNQNSGCYPQQPSAVKKFAPNAYLKRLGLLVTAAEVCRPDANDVNDAMRHALFRLAHRHNSLYRRMLADC